MNPTMKRTITPGGSLLLITAGTTLYALDAPLGWVCVGALLGFGIAGLAVWQMTLDGWLFVKYAELEEFRKPTPDTPERVETIRRADAAHRAQMPLASGETYDANEDAEVCWSCFAPRHTAHRPNCRYRPWPS